VDLLTGPEVLECWATEKRGGCAIGLQVYHIGGE